jgi:hypothetical protein
VRSQPHNTKHGGSGKFLNFGEISCEISLPGADNPVSLQIVISDEIPLIPKPAPELKPADPDDDFNEPLGERQPEANDAIICEGGCQ